MTDHRKRRIRKLADELGVSHRSAANIIAKRTACVRAGHITNRDPHGAKCTDCGFALKEGTDR
jgi:hypothetical protein